MWAFMNANSFDVFVAFIFTMYMGVRLVEAYFDRNKPVVECNCDCGCEEDEDEDEENV
jgi:hypothetical protein